MNKKNKTDLKRKNIKPESKSSNRERGRLKGLVDVLSQSCDFLEDKIKQ